MLFVLIAVTKVMHKTKVHYTIYHLFSTILIKELIVAHPTFQEYLVRYPFLTKLHI